MRETKNTSMASSNSPFLILFSFPALLLSFVIIVASFHHTLGHATEGGRGTYEGVGRRVLLSFKETPKGSNATFECSPFGPCVPCIYSEKSDKKYRCSETGYRIPLKCVEIKNSSKESGARKSKNSRSVLEGTQNNVMPHVFHDTEEYATKHRSLRDDSATSKGRSQAYIITYRSCIPAVNEEKLSVLGFEEIMLGLLLFSGSVIYFRRKRTAAMSGVAGGKIPTNPRF